MQTRAGIQLFICVRCVHKQDSFHRKDPEAQLRLGCTLCPLGSGSVCPCVVLTHGQNQGDGAISGTALRTTQVSATRQRGQRGATGRLEDLQWVKPHSPHPGACHQPQAGIARGVPTVQSGPPEPLEGRQGPILSHEAGETCTRMSGRTETGPCLSQASPAPLHWLPGGRLREGPMHAGPSGWDGGGHASAQGQLP